MTLDEWRRCIPKEHDVGKLNRMLIDWAFDRLSLLVQIMELRETTLRQATLAGIRERDQQAKDLLPLFQYDVTEDSLR
jgi:hypothetical protein